MLYLEHSQGLIWILMNFNKDLYDTKKIFQFPKRTMFERAKKMYNKNETYIIEINKKWHYGKRSANHQV